MTEKLKTLLDERASAPDFPVPDLGAIRAAGTTRRRRQYAGVAAAAASSVAAATALVISLGGTAGSDDAETIIADDKAPEAASARPFDLAHATGSTIFSADGDEGVASVGHQVVAMVSTGIGYVTADPDGGVWSVDGSAVARLGQTDPGYSQLVGDRTSALVGWIDPTGAEPVYVVADQASGEVVTLDVGVPTQRGDDGMTFYALDRGVAYVRGAAGAVAVDVDTGEQQVLDAGASSFDVLGAHDGVVAFEGGGEDAQILLGATRDEADQVIDSDYGSVVYFSPEGRYLSVEGDVLAVFDTKSGQAVEFGLPEFSVGIGWVDETTLLGFQLSDDEKQMQLLECSTESVTCEVVDPAVVSLKALDAGDYVFANGDDYSPDRN